MAGELQTRELQTKVNQLVDFSAEQFVSTIGQYKWDLIPDSQLIAAKAALTKSDFLMKIAAGNPEAVHDSLMKAAILGLDLTEGKKQGWLIPRKNQNGKMVIVLQPGYKGVEAIHQRMGVIDRLSIRVVYENDDFEWSGDDTDKPNHKAQDWFDSAQARGKIKGAFCITYYPDGTINTTVASIEDIFTKHRDKSDSYRSYVAKDCKGYPPPWVSNEKEMIEKTMAYIAAKQWPANIRNADQSSKIVETLTELDYSDYTFDYTPKQRDAFFGFIENKDALGLNLFIGYVELEVYLSLFKLAKNQVERGGKIKKGEEIANLSDNGNDIFNEIQAALDENDDLKLMENIEDISKPVMAMLKKRLNDEQLKSLKEMTGEDQ